MTLNFVSCCCLSNIQIELVMVELQLVYKYLENDQNLSHWVVGHTQGRMFLTLTGQLSMIPATLCEVKFLFLRYWFNRL